jgi:hypothetical protein
MRPAAARPVCAGAHGRTGVRIFGIGKQIATGQSGIVAGMRRDNCRALEHTDHPAVPEHRIGAMRSMITEVSRKRLGDGLASIDTTSRVISSPTCARSSGSTPYSR